MKIVKSDLQTRLESEGWEWLTNESSEREYALQTDPITGVSRTEYKNFFPKSSPAEIHAEYAKRFPAVRVEPGAYDVIGKL
ncbi:MAG: hypothetical protein AABX86_00570, partial [Nanoarchaeota archaeon]